MSVGDRSESKYESEQRLGPSATEWSGYQLPAFRAAVVAQKHKQSLVRVGRPEFVESISDPHVQNYETMTIAEVSLMSVSVLCGIYVAQSLDNAVSTGD